MTPDFPGAPGPELAHSHGTAGVPAPLGVGQRCWIQRFEQEQIEATEESRQAVARNPKSPMTESERLGYSNFVIRASLCFLRYLLLKGFSPNRVRVVFQPVPSRLLCLRARIMEPGPGESPRPVSSPLLNDAGLSRRAGTRVGPLARDRRSPGSVGSGAALLDSKI